MPKSKRDKKVSLTKTTKKGLQLKQKTIEGIRNAINKYEHVFLLTIKNMRNAKLKDLREDWKDSKFFFGKNKVIALALGKTKSEEVEDDINLLSQKLKGQCGLLMTNRDVPDVIEFFKNYSEAEFARTGFKATQDVILPNGPLEGFSHAIEPHLRRLGLPTSLERGVINLIKEYQVCKNGQSLTPEQASILKLLGIQMAKFHVVIKCHWSKGKGFHKNEDVQSDDEEAEAGILQDEEMDEDREEDET